MKTLYKFLQEVELEVTAQSKGLGKLTNRELLERILSNQAKIMGAIFVMGSLLENTVADGCTIGIKGPDEKEQN